MSRQKRSVTRRAACFRFLPIIRRLNPYSFRKTMTHVSLNSDWSKRAALALIFLSIINIQQQSIHAQGSLTPPGAPAATMKSLDQVYAKLDPRIPITNSSSAVTISAPGSYYLTTNLIVSTGTAITIATNGVTLDLSGFSISSTAASATGNGILINGGVQGVVIQNGFIRSGATNNGLGTYSGSGFSSGIHYASGTATNVLVSKIQISGCVAHGINLGNGGPTIVDSCVVRTAGSYGINASTIRNSTALDCGNSGIFGYLISDCFAVSTGSFSAMAGKSLLNCRASNTGNGDAISAVSAENCYGDSVAGYGVNASSAINCRGASANDTGVYATTAQNCVGTSTSGIGLYANVAQSCYGGTGSSYGLYSGYQASACMGYSGSGVGLFAGNASFCTGFCSGGRAIEATIATGCYASAGTNLITYKYNMP
jgi:hypothetical protein